LRSFGNVDMLRAGLVTGLGAFRDSRFGFLQAQYRVSFFGATSLGLRLSSNRPSIRLAGNLRLCAFALRP